LGPVAAPGGLLDGAIDFPKPLGWDAQRDDLADPHHHIPTHDLDIGWRKRLVETLRPQLRLDLVERFRLVVLEKDRQQERALASLGGGWCCRRGRRLLRTDAAGEKEAQGNC